MTYNQFIAECNSRLIEPSLALENNAIKQALCDKDDNKVKELLDREF